MADPLSIVAGTVGLADVCARTIKFLKDAQKGLREIDRDIESLREEISSLQTANHVVASTYEKITTSWQQDTDLQQNLSAHWRATNDTLSGCQNIVEQLETLLKSIVGTENHGKLGKFRKWLKYESKEQDFDELRTKLQTRQNALQIIIEATNLSVSFPTSILKINMIT